MTAPARLHVLLDRACRGVATPAEGEQLRAAVAELQQEAEQQRAQLAACHRDIHSMAELILGLIDELKRYERYRTAWQSARRRARLIPFGGNQVYGGARWRPALQAYSTLRTRLARVEQQLDATSSETP